MADLVQEQELSDHLRRPVTAASAASAIRGAEALLRGATRLDVWPVPVPEDLRFWALELAGLIYDNPLGKATTATGAENDGYVVNRRAEILAAAASRYGPGPAATPLFDFPAVDPFPVSYVARPWWYPA